MTLTSRLDPLIAPLQVPPHFSRYEKLVETDIIASLEQWKLKTDTCLAELRDLVARESTQFSVQDHALVVSTIASFEGEGSWITSVSRDISKGEWIVISCMTDPSHLAKPAEILALYYGEPSATLLETVLTHHVKPIFSLIHTHLSTCPLVVNYRQLQVVLWACKITTKGRYGRDTLEHRILCLGVCVIFGYADTVLLVLSAKV